MFKNNEVPLALALPINDDEEGPSSYGSIVINIDQVDQPLIKNDEEASSSSSWVSKWSGLVADERPMNDPRKVTWLVAVVVLTAYMAVVYAVFHWDNHNNNQETGENAVGENQNVASLLQVMQHLHLRNDFHL